MASGDYYIHSLYQPTYSSFKPGENAPANYLGKSGMIKAGQVGMATNPTVANQLGELSKLLNTGAIPVEVGTIDMKNFDSIPKEHWEEIRRNADLNNAKISIHAPLVDPSGFGEKGWDPVQQKLAERQLNTVMDAAFLATSKKNSSPIPVTIHPGNYPGSTYAFEINEESKKREKIAEQLIGVDKSTGQLVPIQREKRISLGSDKLEIRSAEEMLNSANATQWRKEMDKILYEKEHADKVINTIYPHYKDMYAEITLNLRDPNKLPEEVLNGYNQLNIAFNHLEDAKLSLDNSFEKAYKYGDEKTKEELKKISQDFANQLGIVSEKEFTKMSDEEKINVLKRKYDLENYSKLIQNTTIKLSQYNPKMIQRVEDFAIEKSSETLKNVAFETYKKAKEKNTAAPQISLENLYQGLAFSQSEDVAKMIEETRKKFKQELEENEKLNSFEAGKIAEQMIGATFDVGHANLSRNHGYTEEDLKKEAEAIAKYVNKVHLTDNFGNVDTHLPLGMGNVPVEILLEALGEKGKEAVKINEIGGYNMNYGKLGFSETLEALGSPLYNSGSGPNWAQINGYQQGYFSGMGMSLPQMNYETFGSGFSLLPSELGGSRNGGGIGGRMGGGRE